MSPEVNAATKVGACRMKIISEGTPYLEKKPCSLAAQSGRTRALTAAWAMMVLAGADAASRAFSEIDSPRTTKKNATHLLIVHPSFPDTPAEPPLTQERPATMNSKSQSEKLNRVLAENFSLILL